MKSKTGLVNTTDETIIKKKKKTLGTLKVYREDLQRLIDLQEQRDELIKMV